MSDVSPSQPRGGLAAWVLAARPKTIPASIAPVVIGTALALADASVHWPTALCCLVGAVLIQIGTNFCNDYYDFKKGADTAARKGPVRAVQAGLIRPADMLRATVLVLLGAALICIYLVLRAGVPMAVIGAASILFAVLYTAGPAPLAYVGLGDVFVMLFFGLIAVCGTYYAQALALPAHVVVASLAPGFFSMGLLTVNNLRDVDEDRVVGKRTVAVRFGRDFARAEYFFCVVAACAVPAAMVALYGRGFFSLLACLVLLPALSVARRVREHDDGPGLNPALAGTARLLMLYTVLFAAGWAAS